MSSTQTLHPDSLLESWPGVAAGLVIFLISGLALILNELPLGFQLPAWAKNINSLILIAFYLSPMFLTRFVKRVSSPDALT